MGAIRPACKKCSVMKNQSSMYVLQSLEDPACVATPGYYVRQADIRRDEQKIIFAVLVKW